MKHFIMISGKMEDTALIHRSSLRAIRKAALRALRCFTAAFAHEPLDPDFQMIYYILW